MHNATDAGPGIEVLQAGERLYNDSTNAEALIEAHGHEIRFVKGWGWLAYDGTRWVVDAEHLVIEFAKATLQQMAVRAVRIADSRERGALLGHVNRSLDYNRLMGMLKSAQSDPRIWAEVDTFDRDPWLFNIKNGTLDLRTGDLMPHDAEDYITRIAGIAYDPDAQCPQWEQFLSDIMGGDAEMVGYLQRAFGYSLTGLVSEKVFFLCYGATGNNGKSTMLEAFLPVMGTYGAAANWRTFLSTGGGGRSIATDLAALVGVRYAISAEPPKGARLQMDRLKNITGGDTMIACNLYQPEFEFKPQLKYWFSANEEPEVPESGNATWNRIRKVPFTQDFSDRMDKGLKDRMIADELPGMLAWAVRGCQAWRERRKLDEPQVMLDALSDYRDAQDPLRMFIKERCAVEAEARTPGKDMHSEYGQWCRDTFGEWEGRKLAEVSPTKFYEALRQHSYTVKRIGGKGQTVFELRLREDEDE